MLKRTALVLLPLFLLSLPACALCIGGAAGGILGYGLAEKGKWPPPPNKARYPHSEPKEKGPDF